MHRFEIITRSAFFALGLILIGPITLSVLGVSLVSLKTGFLVALFATLYLAAIKIRNSKEHFSEAAVATAFIIAISDFPNRNHAMLEGLMSPGMVLILLIALSGFIYLLSKLNLKNSGFLIVSLISLVFSFVFLKTLGFELLFSDDHPTFLFRLETLKQSFPFIPSYNPLWNAGIHFRDFFASGALAVYLFFLPFIYLFDLSKSYNFIIIILFFFLPVLTSYLTCKFLRLNKLTFCILAILSITSSTEWYRWGISFGTLGFILATQLLPFLIGFVWKISEKEALTKFEIAVSLLFLTLMLLWPIAVLFTFPAIIFCLFYSKNIFSNRSALITIGIVLLINIPWMLKFYEVSKVESFLEESTTEFQNEDIPINEPLKSEKVLNKNPGLKYYFNFLRHGAKTTNIFILLFGLPGIFFLPSKKLRFLFLSTLTWLVLLSTLGSTIKPQLELDRFLLVAIYLLAIPAAAFAANQEGKIKLMAIYFLLICGVFGTYRILQNKTLVRFYPKQPIVGKLSHAISAHTQSGRAIFSGFILHELSHGHIAPLIYKSGVPLIARSYKHDHWEYHEVIPNRYLKDNGRRIEEFMDLYNVETIITFNRQWRDYFKKKKELYKEVWHQENFRLFKRLKPANTYFLQGEGEIIKQNSNSVNFRLHSKDAVIKFNYIEGLKVKGCDVSPHNVEGPVTLIELKNCPLDTELKLSL